MVRELRSGIEQIVILGAGFDTRAYRLPEAASVPVFEVDHPVTQLAKREALRGVVDPLPANVHFVGVDFDHDDLGERLREEGYDENRRTLFVWQGVIVYLTRDGADNTLAFIAKHSAPGSLVVFDTMDCDALSGAGSTGLRFFTSAMGEKVTFGIGHREIVPYLETRGFTDVAVFDHTDMQRQYLGHRPIAAGVYIATARVKGDR
jgi:methyltransferase (TIGR00027 family)